MNLHMTDPVKSVVQKHWHGRAARYDEQANHGIHSAAQRDAWLKVLGDFAGTRPQNILDIGAGTGFLSLLLAELGHHVVGVDLAEGMLERAREKASAANLDVTFMLADAESIDASDASFDLAIERHVLWTLPHPSEALIEWKRLLRPGGSVGLIEGDWGSPASPDYLPIQDSLPLLGGKPSPEIVALLQETGFGEIRIEPLMSQDLWGAEVTRERYLAIGRRLAR